ncbi:hypothetical protein QR685DRAFT_447105 [Neurospora intermedia]|uniref:Uncharacterized protein n=1 Tax=Neurospora intermedia TaxID=5142 RepID=A0ABR3D728_NEUIN
MAISHSPTKTETVRLIQPQRDASKRLRQLQSSERQKRHQSDTTSEAFPQSTTFNSTTKTALSTRAHTKKQNSMSLPALQRVIVRLSPSHVRDAMQFIPIEDILDYLIAKNLGKILNEEEIATAATYYFVDVCSTYPAFLIRFAANVLIRHFEPILERATARHKVYETLKAKTQFVKAMRAICAELAKAFVEADKADLWMPKGL